MQSFSNESEQVAYQYFDDLSEVESALGLLGPADSKNLDIGKTISMLGNKDVFSTKLSVVRASSRDSVLRIWTQNNLSKTAAAIAKGSIVGSDQVEKAMISQILPITVSNYQNRVIYIRNIFWRACLEVFPNIDREVALMWATAKCSVLYRESSVATWSHEGGASFVNGRVNPNCKHASSSQSGVGLIQWTGSRQASVVKSIRKAMNESFPGDSNKAVLGMLNPVLQVLFYYLEIASWIGADAVNYGVANNSSDLNITRFKDMLEGKVKPTYGEILGFVMVLQSGTDPDYGPWNEKLIYGNSKMIFPIHHKGLTSYDHFTHKKNGMAGFWLPYMTVSANELRDGIIGLAGKSVKTFPKKNVCFVIDPNDKSKVNSLNTNTDWLRHYSLII